MNIFQNINRNELFIKLRSILIFSLSLVSVGRMIEYSNGNLVCDQVYSLVLCWVVTLVGLYLIRKFLV
jgi:hypothetical protein